MRIFAMCLDPDPLVVADQRLLREGTGIGSDSGLW